MNRERVSKGVLLGLLILISGVFVAMIRHFLMAVLLAGIFSALARPFYRRVERLLGGRSTLASLVTLFLIVVVVLLPLGTLLGIVTAQAIKVGQSVRPFVEQWVARPTAFSDLFEQIPFYDQVLPYKATMLQKAGELVGSLSRFLINSLSAATVMTVQFIFMLLVMLYTMFFFLIDGERLLNRILYYLPLKDQDERRMLERFTSVTRATLKGTLIIGILQGGLAGIAFAVAGIPSAVFWGTVMTVLSIIPGIGTTLVWGPAALILAAGGHFAAGIGLALFCGMVVGSVDNLLRPRLVGQDTKMHDLMILFSTLGGIAMFGVLGFIIGPIIAALFITAWEIYGVMFRDLLPEVHDADGTSDVASPSPAVDVGSPDQESGEDPPNS